MFLTNESFTIIVSVSVSVRMNNLFIDCNDLSTWRTGWPSIAGRSNETSPTLTIQTFITQQIIIN